MTYNKKVERQTEKLIELLMPTLTRKAGRYQTAWGNKTMEGVRAAIFNILVDLDRKYEEEGR